MKIDEAVAATAPEPVLAEKSEVTKEGWAIALPKTRIHTLAELVEFFEVDTAVWEVERFIANKWEVGAKVGGKDGKSLAVEPLYQVKAFFRRKLNIVAARLEIEDLKRAAGCAARPATIRRAAKPPSGNMLEMNLPDPHFGKLAWDDETGHGHYDLKIADNLFRAAFQALLDRTSSHRFDEAWFVVGNDLLHSDSPAGKTTAGTPLAAESQDVRYHKTFRVVRSAVIDCIERLRAVAPKVKVIMVPGNHDQLSVWHLGDSLECYFHNYTDVEIDNRPRYRKYHQFGSVALGFTHGDKGKRTDYPLLMATEAPEMFAAARFREIHTGNSHKTKVDEFHGVRVRILPALTGVDIWQSENDVAMHTRAAEAFIWHRDEGLIGTALFNVAPPTAKGD